MRTLAVFVAVILLASPCAFGFQWKASEGFSGWAFKNVQQIEQTEEGVLLFKQPGSGDFGIATPGGLAGDESTVSIRVRTTDPNAFLTGALVMRGSPPLVKTIPIDSGRSWKEYAFDFGERMPAGAAVEKAAFVFTGTDSIEVREVDIDKPSFSEVFRRQRIRGWNVNFLFPFTFHGLSISLWFYIFLVSSGLLTFIYYLSKREKRVFALFGITFLMCYILYDMREIEEEADIVQSTYADYLSAPPGEKRCHHWTDLVEFADFIREHLPSGEKEVTFFGHDFDLRYLGYLLFPIKVVPGQDVLKRVNVFRGDGIQIDSNRLVVGGKVFEITGMIKAYNGDSILLISK